MDWFWRAGTTRRRERVMLRILVFGEHAVEGGHEFRGCFLGRG